MFKKVICFFFLPFALAYGQELGPSETIRLLVDIETKRTKALVAKYQQNPAILGKIQKLADIKIDPDFFRSILFFSKKQYINLLNGNICQFVSLLENNLIATFDGEIQRLPIIFQDGDTTRRLIISRENFLEIAYKAECFQNKEKSSLFALSNINQTLETVDFPVPKNKADCAPTITTWALNPNLPYFCQIGETIIQGKKYSKDFSAVKADSRSARDRKKRTVISRYQRIREAIPLFQRSYLENLCENLERPDRFCSVYLADDVWSKILIGEKPNYFLSHKCRNYLRLDGMPDKKQLLACARTFNQEPSVCHNDTNRGRPARHPNPDCNDISTALIHARLVTNYHDCPAQIDNEAMTNLHRLRMHFDEVENISSESNCAGETYYSFVQILRQAKFEELWPMKICFINPVTEKEECLPYIPGNHQDTNLSEEAVLTNIVKKVKSITREAKCQLVSDRIYNPARLAYKTGCFIVYPANRCSSLECPKKIYFDQKEIEGVRYIGKPTFDYIPNSFTGEGQALVNLFIKAKNRKQKLLRSFTDIEYFFKTYPKGIVHGLGCVEDIIPASYVKRALNQCSPMPFIIDGIIGDPSSRRLVTRLPIDDIHSPRIINWLYIFNSVNSYRPIHRLESWSLYGIY